MAGYRFDDGTSISIEISESDRGRVRYHYFIDMNNDSYENNDLQSGCLHGTSMLQNGLSDLVVFLSAESENTQFEDELIFCKSVQKWATNHKDEIDELSMMLEEEPLIED